MSITATLPKIRQLAVLPRELPPVKLMLIAGGLLAVLTGIMALTTVLRGPQAAVTVSQTISNDVSSQNTDPVVPAAIPAAQAAENVIQVQPMNNVQPVETHFVSLDVDSSLLPGNALPSSVQCGIAHRSPDQANSVVRDCYTRHVPGYLLVHFISDTSNGGILSTTLYVRKLFVRDLVNQWGTPLGYRTNNASSVIYWAGKRAYLTSARLHGADRIEFISFDNTEQHYQPWTALAD
jgi:hypothetical protein